MSIADDWTRFDGWSPLIPELGTEIQIQFEKDGRAYETNVLFRCVDDERRTFTIWVRWPFLPEGELMLNITPNAGPGMVDKADNLKPCWQTVPVDDDTHHPESVKLFFKD